MNKTNTESQIGNRSPGEHRKVLPKTDNGCGQRLLHVWRKRPEYLMGKHSFIVLFSGYSCREKCGRIGPQRRAVCLGVLNITKW